MRDQRAEVSLNIAPHEQFDSAPLESRDFRILVLGDFSGRGDGAATTNATPRRVDRDDLDAHVARIAPRMRITVNDTPIDLAFASMDDFVPDRLIARMTSLLGGGQAHQVTPRAAEPSTPNRAPADLARTVSGASLLDDMIDDARPAPDAPAGAQATRASRSDELSAFIERAVAPHLVKAPDESTMSQAESKRRETTELLRAVLHHPDVQALEAAWRSIEFLVRRLDTDGALHLFMLDVPRDQVAAALERMAQQRDANDHDGWALAIAIHEFPDGDAGADALARIAMAAREFGTPCVAAAPPAFTGRSSATSLSDDETAPAPAPEVFTLIRRSLEARFLGLTFPRFLVRAPYGRENPADTIDFEEIDDGERHSDFLWSSGAVLVALLVGEAFNERGWAIGQRLPLDVGSLPYFTYRRGPENVAKPCAETIMSEKSARHLLSRGLMPVAWIKDTDRVRVIELRSAADPAAPLAAAWAGATSGSRA